MGMSKKLITILLQFDFSKAFDTVSSTVLLKKLKEAGFSRGALMWLRSYLKGRQLRVTSGASLSNSRDVNLGVPQGSVLGPLLFCLYMNDISKHLGPGVFHLLYADDLQVYIQVPPDSISDGVKTLAESLNGLN